MSTSVASQLAILSNVSVLLYYEITQQLTVENFDQPDKMANVEDQNDINFEKDFKKQVPLNLNHPTTPNFE